MATRLPPCVTPSVRLEKISGTMLEELSQDTVHFRPNYDGTRTEPVVLPARFPQLLVNGTTGIAVGMATSIPPHNLEEVCTASIRLLDALVASKELSNRELLPHNPRPGFPDGRADCFDRRRAQTDLRERPGYDQIRSTWRVESESRGQKTITITSIPYNVNKSTLVERIADVVTSRQMPLLLDVKDVSTDDVRVELSIKKDADEQKVMAYLFRHTPLQSTFSVNMTSLVPTENPEVGRPERLDFGADALALPALPFGRRYASAAARTRAAQSENAHFGGFRDGVRRPRRDSRDCAKSEGKQDAAAKIMARFKLDAEQTDAILELKIYRLARLEILVIQKELAEKRKRAKDIAKLLAEEESVGIWGIVRAEIEEIIRDHGKGDKRRTIIAAPDAEKEYSAEELIVAEDNHVLLTRDGWVKRQKEIKDISTTRLREGDQVLAWVAGSTRATVAFFSNFGSVYTSRLIDIPATTGYGEPIQKLLQAARQRSHRCGFLTRPPRDWQYRRARRQDPRIVCLSRHV